MGELVRDCMSMHGSMCYLLSREAAAACLRAAAGPNPALRRCTRGREREAVRVCGAAHVALHLVRTPERADEVPKRAPARVSRAPY